MRRVFRCPKCAAAVEIEQSSDDDTRVLCCAEGCDGQVTMVEAKGDGP